METLAFQILMALSGLATLACWAALWHGRDPIPKKLLWTVISAAPVLGPLLYAGMHDPPSIQAEVDRAPGRDWDTLPPDHHSPP